MCKMKTDFESKIEATTKQKSAHTHSVEEK